MKYCIHVALFDSKNKKLNVFPADCTAKQLLKFLPSLVIVSADEGNYFDYIFVQVIWIS